MCRQSVLHIKKTLLETYHVDNSIFSQALSCLCCQEDVADLALHIVFHRVLQASAEAHKSTFSSTRMYLDDLGASVSIHSDTAFWYGHSYHR